LELTNSILKDVRVAVGLSEDATDFDTDLTMNINSTIAKLNQNGVGRFVVVNDTSTTWADLQDPLQVEGNLYFGMVPLLITLSTKLVFDPPPPSTVEYHSQLVEQLLWRLKISYEILPTTDATQ
jgi:hypothetical protein